MENSVIFNSELIRRYDTTAPRYTSYPTAVEFTTAFTEADYLVAADLSNEGEGAKPLSLYFHLPFCAKVCFYCACNKIVTANRARAAPYLALLHREVKMQSSLFDAGRPVDQLHWGGGTPTFLSDDEIAALMAVTRDYFGLREDDHGEYSIEVDPRELREGTLALLRSLGFNRLSLGVQDFDPDVQRAVNRFQSEGLTLNTIRDARVLGFRSVNLDLIYGLPRQTPESFARTLDKVIAARPDRLSVFNYAHLPLKFKTQRQIVESELPRAETKLSILQHSIEQLAQAGYVYIGMDHFALPTDELAQAQQRRSLYRNFQGYATHAECDLVALGITGISRVGDSYAQNVKTIEEYEARLSRAHIPIERGIKLSADDKLRRDLIMDLICHFSLDIPSLEARHRIRFAEYFAEEIADLEPLQRDGLILVSDRAISVLPVGRLLIRNVCKTFDRYRRIPSPQPLRYSRAI